MEDKTEEKEIGQYEVKPIKEEWLTRRKKFLWLIPYGKPIKVTKEELIEKEPILLYISDEHRITVHKRFKVGKMNVVDRHGRELEYFNLIEARKRLMMDYGGVEIPVYIQFQKELYPYPIEPVVDAEEISKLFRILIMNYKMLEEKLGLNKLTWEGVKKWLMLIGGIIGIALAALWIMKTFGLGEYLGIMGNAANITSNLTNTTNITMNITTLPPAIIG